MVLDDTITDMASAEVFWLAQTGELFAEVNIRAEAILETVTATEHLTGDDVRMLADAVARVKEYTPPGCWSCVSRGWFSPNSSVQPYPKNEKLSPFLAI